MRASFWAEFSDDVSILKAGSRPELYILFSRGLLTIDTDFCGYFGNIEIDACKLLSTTTDIGIHAKENDIFIDSDIDAFQSSWVRVDIDL